MRKSTVIWMAAALGWMAPGAAGLAHAQNPDSYPQKPIKFVVPYPPGGSTDSMARAFAQGLAKELKTPVVIENKPGAGTSIGALTVKNAPADGYTLLFQTGELLTSKLTNPSLAYEIANFEIITPLAQTPYALMVPAQHNIKNLDDLKARAAKKGGELDFGSLGFGANHFSFMSNRLSEQLGVKARMIPYKGGMEGVTAIMSGDIDGYFATIGLSLTQKESSKLRLIAVSSDDLRSSFLPGVPTFKELGLKDLGFKSYYGIAVRSDTPADLKKRLIEVSRKVADSDELKKLRAQIALEDFPGSLADYKAVTLRTFNYLKTEYEKSPAK